MARILYGVHGTANGHAIRALTIARHYPEHKFLFVSHAEGAALLSREFPVANHSNPDTRFRAQRVDTVATVLSNLRFFLRQNTQLRSVLKLIDTFKPDIAISDYEFLVPLASHHIGLPCLSLDHQHVITLCSHSVPDNQIVSSLMTGFAVRFLFSKASHFIVTSFFQAPLKHKNARLVPPLLRDSVLKTEPEDGNHVLAYQSTSTFDRFFSFLKMLNRPVKVYGFHSDHTEGNLQFKRHSEHGFLEDLASCSYVICGGGHTLISEALHYGKPIISFPIANAFEQYLNAIYIDRLGYGFLARDLDSALGKITAFEGRLNLLRANIKRENFNGNAEVFSLLDYFIREKKLPAVPPLSRP
jgi:uncharacterized protein (TIGR00661 family)